MSEPDDEPEEVPDADAELYDRLRRAHCTGPLWDHVAAELARLGWAVMSAWLASRVIAGKCREKGRPVTLPVEWTAEDREDLVATSVAHGIETFRRSLADDRWKAEKGASLRTYFIGGCVLAFPNALRSWQHDRERYLRAAQAWAREPRCPTVESVDLATAVQALKTLTGDDSERARAIKHLRFLDYAPAEIAEVLGMSPGAVNTALYRMKRRGQGDGGERT
ncbi:RNA polymerase sigma factor [Amycolatopsis sp. YIM 10]|uniref:RNA polymerase sigma factor n=1 Tax=Amycolatopsis sp. YIM 10 TaxID=2653857 RepID=UPI0012903BEE|nr:sigma factor-like helix-turn-helix DNA-binding protein [Amycolatopsis sp. YIM 10]QFU91824.1 hypothetical protein YIM_33315 [Amycolatopsis sp. YIM 10]